ncbi:MAG TPA: response regulator [Burkholderiales bacterium]|nr:response regulator [Burkholderiales bacterium]
MRTPPRILVVDDTPANVHVLKLRLTALGYEVVTAADGREGLIAARETKPDLILLDVMMPNVDGIQVCRELRADPAFPFVPIVMVTAKADSKDVVAGLDAGADEYLPKPVDHNALAARVKSMLRIKNLHDTVQAQAAELAEWNRTLEQRVTEQVAQVERLGQLKGFFSPQLAEVILSPANEKLLASHRREITVVFCDLRGFTAFSETAEPEEVMGVLAEYHAEIGEEIFRFEGTLERFAGDGLMVFFNDPLPCADAPARAVHMALAMRSRAGTLATGWRKRGYQLGFGVGISQGYATLGKIGYKGRVDYGAIGTVSNLASRLCDEAEPGQILVSQRVRAAVEDLVETESVGELRLKGFLKPVPAFNVVRAKDGT